MILVPSPLITWYRPANPSAWLLVIAVTLPVASVRCNSVV